MESLQIHLFAIQASRLTLMALVIEASRQQWNCPNRNYFVMGSPEEIVSCQDLGKFLHCTLMIELDYNHDSDDPQPEVPVPVTATHRDKRSFEAYIQGHYRTTNFSHQEHSWDVEHSNCCIASTCCLCF